MSYLQRDEGLITEVDANETAVVKQGVWLCTSANMEEEKKGWGEFDENKHKDFSASPYWLFADDGSFIAIDTADELAEELEDIL